MHPIRTIALAALSAVIATMPAVSAVCAPAERMRTAPRHFVLVNASHESATSFAVAPAGQESFEEIVLGAPLRGGTTSATVRLPDGGCLRDFRIAFGDGRVLLYPDIDTCRYQRLQLTHRDGRDSRPGPDRPVAGAP
jgi:hypothetical protein